MPRRGTWITASGVALLCALSAACSAPGAGRPELPADTNSTVPTAVAAAPGTAPGTARAALDRLPVKGRAPLTGYDRDEFGPAWTDDTLAKGGHNGCDTRNDMLGRDLTGSVRKPGTNGCVVLRGTLADPYSGTVIGFVRGRATSARVQIDHVVALADAWQKGAQSLSPDRRRALANDPLELLAVSGPLNQAKGAGDAATWLPPQRSYRCAYVARQIAVKRAYSLWVTAAERAATLRVLGGCPTQDLPVG